MTHHDHAEGAHLNTPVGTPESIAMLARAVGTPAYIYRPSIAATRMKELADALARALAERALVAYAVKANPRAEILKALAPTGCHFDVASLGELRRMAAIDVPGRRMVLSGPVKSEVEVRRALAMGVRINLEGMRDARLVSAWGREHGRLVTVNVRLNPCAAGPGGIIGGGGPSRFGVDETVMDEVVGAMAREPQLAIGGVQVFTASNVLDPAHLAAHHRQAFRLARRVHDLLGGSLEVIDVGGGLGIPYADTQSDLSIEAVASGLRAVLDENTWFGGRVLLEPGRWISGPAGVYVARVCEVKWSQGVRFALIDGGIHHLLRPALLGTDQPCMVLPRPDGATPTGELVPTTLGGPLCTGLDILAHRVPLGDVAPGDLVAFLQAGAYGETEAMPDFLLHPRPKVAIV